MAYIRIRKHYIHVPYLLLGSIEFGLLFCSVYLLHYLQTAFNIVPTSHISTSFVDAFGYAIILSCGSLAMGVYLAMMREGFTSMFFRTLVAYCFLGALAVSLLSIFFPLFDFGGTNLFLVVMVSTGLILSTRQIFSRVVDSEQISRRLVVLGTGDSAQQLQRDYEKVRRGLAIRVIGYIGSDKNAIDASYCIAPPSDWLAFCRANKVSEIVVAEQERRSSDGAALPLDQLIQCKLAGIEVINAINFYERELTKINLDITRPSSILFADGFRQSKSRDWAKRAFDLTVSLLLALVLLPFIALAALAVFIETGRPILYSQTRTGKDGKPFKIYKLRSMRQDAEKHGKAVWASANDSRITKVGAFIRNTRLDEIPQLWNVLKGEMSFVGPRPERPEFVEQLEKEIPFYQHRHAIKPGLMGWAQLNYPYGASVADARGKLEYDLYYVKNQSFIMDILIMIQTVEVILLGKGVH